MIAPLILAGIGLLWFLATMNTSIAVNASRIDAMQKSQETWTSIIRDEVRRVESTLTTRITEVSNLVDGLLGKGSAPSKKR